MINVMYCGNYKVFDGILISSLSMVKNTKEDITFHILTMDLSNENKEYKPINDKQINFLEKTLKKYNGNIKVISYDMTKIYIKSMKHSVNSESIYTPYAFLRLVSDKIDNFPSKVLYLDVDTIVSGNISELYHIDMEDNELAVVKDYLGRFFINYNYFNSGMLLINMDEIKATKLFEKSIDLCKDKRLAFPDQSALNHLVKRKIYLPRKFNEQRRAYSDTIIRHFSKTIRFFPRIKTINVKPWEVEKVKKILKIHMYDDLLIEYQNCINEFNKEK